MKQRFELKRFLQRAWLCVDCSVFLAAARSAFRIQLTEISLIRRGKKTQQQAVTPPNAPTLATRLLLRINR